MHLRTTGFLSGIALLTLAVPGARAADILWNSGVTGDYLTPSNWQGGSLPTDADTAMINNGTANLNSSTASARRLQVGSAAGQTGNFSMLNSEFHAKGSDLVIGDGGTGSVTVENGKFTVNRWVHMGRNGGTGTLTLKGNAELLVELRPVQDPPLEENEFWVGGENGGTATLTMEGSSTVTFYSNMYVGANNAAATGHLNMSGTSEIHAYGGNNFLIGTGGGTGHATLTGFANIDKINTLGGGTGHFAVGIGGGSQGTLTMRDDAEIFSAGQFRVGAGGGTGTLNMHDRAKIEVADQFWIGNAGGSTGKVVMEGGSIIVDNWFAIGREGGNGTLEMSGGLIELTGAIAGGNLTTAALGGGVVATIDHSGGTIRNTATNTFLSETGTTFWTASGDAVGEFGRFVVNQGGVAAFFTIEGNANYTATTLAVKGGGEVNFDGGTFTADTLSVEAGGASPAVVNFNGGTVNIPRITIASGAVLDTTAPFTVANGRTLAGIGSGAATMLRNVTVASGGKLSTHDTEIGTFLLEGVTLQTGAALEFDVNGLAPNDQMIVDSLAANGTIALTIHNLNAGTLETGVAYTLITGDTLSGTATFDVTALDGLVLDESYGTGGYLFDTTAGTLSVQFAAVPEPGTVALVAFGLAFGAWRLRRRSA